MPRFFSDNIIDDKIFFTKEDAIHITKSLRMKEGEEIIICDEKGKDYHCKLAIDSEDIYGKIFKVVDNDTETKVKITLYQALAKGDKMDFIIQKAVELGAEKIIPFVSSRCIAREKKENASKKLARYNKIALEASKQSSRGIIPKVMATLPFEKALTEAKNYDMSFICYENGGDKLSSFSYEGVKNICIFIGSEGGFSKEEIDLANKHGSKNISLGKRILRCETASIVALSSLLTILDEI